MSTNRVFGSNWLCQTQLFSFFPCLVSLLECHCQVLPSQCLRLYLVLLQYCSLRQHGERGLLCQTDQVTTFYNKLLCSLLSATTPPSKCGADWGSTRVGSGTAQKQPGEEMTGSVKQNCVVQKVCVFVSVSHLHYRFSLCFALVLTIDKTSGCLNQTHLLIPF